MPEHPKTCACNGRGWFMEHEHAHSCFDPDCVGCVRRQVPCREPDIGSPTPPAEDKVVDLMAALEQSIVEAKAARDRKQAAEDHGSPEASS